MGHHRRPRRWAGPGARTTAVASLAVLAGVWLSGLPIATASSPGSDTLAAEPAPVLTHPAAGASISLAQASYDVGQNASIQGSGFGGSLTITAFTFGGVGLSCTSATGGGCSRGTITTSPSGTFAVTFLVPAFTTAQNYTLVARDSSGTSASRIVPVYLDPRIASITASRPSADVGQLVVFGAAVSLGSGGYSYLWRGLPGCSGTTDPVNCTTSRSGTVTITLQVTDSNLFQVQQDLLAYTVYQDPAVSAPMIVATGTTSGVASVDVGQNVTISTQASLGTGVFPIYTWTGLPSNCSGNTSAITCVPAAPEAGPVSVTVTDSNLATSAASATPIAVFGDPIVATPTANRSSADVGQSVNFATSVALGTGAYSISWSGLPLNCPLPGSALSENCTVGWAGVSQVRVTVTDSDDYRVASGSLRFPVYADPTVTVVAPGSMVDPGVPFHLGAAAGLGSGGFSYVWSGLPYECPTVGATINCTTNRSGTYHVVVAVNDSNHVAAVSALVLLGVVNPIVVRASAEPTSATLGQTVSFVATASGGIGPAVVAWEFGDHGRATGSDVEHAYPSVGQYVVVLWANDSLGASAEGSLRVNVSSPAPTFLGLPEMEGKALLVGSGAGILLAGLGLVLVRRRRARDRSESPAAAESDGVGSDGPESTRGPGQT